MIPILFEKDTTTFNSNGLGRLTDMISCVVVEERNSIYECNFDYPIGGANFSEIQCGRIIGVTHDDTEDIQPFDIVSYEKPIDGIVTFHAVHISYRLRGYVVDQTDVDSLADAMTKLATATPSNSFTYTADFTATGYAGAFNGVPRTVRQLLGGVEGSILDTYGGEYEWDKFQVKLHQHRGDVVNFAIRYGVNMVDFKDDTDYANTYTTAIPYWIGDDGEGGQIIVKGNKVNSGLTPFDGHERCVPLDLSDKFETAPTTTDLENLALSMMVSRSVNLPKQTIKVDFVRLQDYGEYTLLSNLLECKLCDSIEVIFPDYSMSGFFKIVRTEYDVLENRYSSMELGALATTLSQALGIGEQSSGMTSGGGSAVRFGVCSTGGGTVAKVVTVTPPITGLTTGMLIYVKFDNTNTASNPTLNVNGTGAYAIKRYGTTAPSTSSASSWNAGSVCALVYDGTYWQMVGWQNTTYSSMSDAEYQAGTSTTARLITPARLKSAVLYHATPSNIGAVPTSRTVNSKALSANITLSASDVGALPLSGGTMTGQIKTSFKESVATGSYGSAQNTVDGLVGEVRFSSGCMGSASIGTAYTKGSITIPTGWYNYIYSPHRSGGANGSASGDNCNYGNLLLMGMTVSGAYLIRVASAAIQEVKILGSDYVRATFTPTSGSSYSNYGGCYYEKYGRVVHVHVGVSGLSTGASTNIYTLPSGYRPTSPVFAHGTGGSWNNIGYMEISTAGVVTVRSQGTYCGADVTFMV